MRDPSTNRERLPLVARTRRTVQRAVSPAQWNDGWFRRTAAHAGLTAEVVEVPNGSVHCWVGGEGPPVLLLHGFGSDALWQTAPQMGPFARRHRLVVPDLLFFGRSTSSRPDRSPEFQAETLLQVMDHYGIFRSDVVGISYGGIVGWALALAFPRRVRRLVLVDSPGHVFTRSDLARVLVENDIAHLTELLLPQSAADVRRLLAIAWYRPPRVPDFVASDLRRFNFSHQVDEKRQLLEHLVERIDDPTIHEQRPAHEMLLVWGRHDRLFTVEVGERLAATLAPRARLHVLARTGHVPNTQRPRAFNKAVLEFLAS